MWTPDKESTLYAVMLSELPQVGERLARAIIECSEKRGHGLASFFRLPAPVLQRDYPLPEAARRCLEQHGEAHRRRCEWLAGQLVAHGGWACTLLDAEYPNRLRWRASPPPPVFFAVGEARCQDFPVLAVLHSRTPTADTMPAISAVVQRAAEEGFTLVTSTGKVAYRLVGMASRATGAPRIVVLDRGLFSALGPDLSRDPCVYAPSPTREFAKQPQMVCSAFRLLDHALPRNGARRDALVAAFADLILVLHARPGGEIERVCLQALDRGQPVLCWKGENPALVAAGAIPVSESDLGSLAHFLALSGNTGVDSGQR